MAGTAYLTVKEVAEELRVCPATVYTWVAQQKIPFVKLHRVLRFRREDLDRWVEMLKNESCARKLVVPTRDPARTIDALIARARREAYTRAHGETGRLSGSIGKEETDGAV